jgi:hypothetical protein
MKGGAMEIDIAGPRAKIGTKEAGRINNKRSSLRIDVEWNAHESLLKSVVRECAELGPWNREVFLFSSLNRELYKS